MSGAKKKADRRAQIAEMGMSERQKQELKAKQAKQRNRMLITVGGIVTLLLVVALLAWYFLVNQGFMSRHTTALSVKGHDLSVADMDYYYSQVMNNYASQEASMAQMYQQAGLPYESTFDISGDMTQQYVDAEQTKSYHDYFKEQAKESAVQICALYDAAVADGYTLSEDAQKRLDEALDDLDAQVKQYNFGSRNAYLKRIYGKSMTEGVYMDNLRMNVLASDYYSAKTAEMSDYSDEELNAYYNENANDLDSYDYDYVYFDGTVSSTDAEGNVVDGTDEEKAAALAEAQKGAEDLLAAANAAEAGTTFTDVATAQGATASPRTGVMGANFASAVYAQWLMDSARKEGDTEKFEVEDAGWYVIQFHKRYLDNAPTVNARHILLSTAFEDDPDTADVDESQQEVTEERIAEVKAKAEEVLAQFNAGETTAEAFGSLAEEYSADGRNEDGTLYKPGGLYEDIAKGDMVKPFEDWIFDASRQEGDTGLVQTDFGWHVMYFVGANRPAWMDRAASSKASGEQDAFMDKAQEGYEAVEGSGWAQVGRRV